MSDRRYSDMAARLRAPERIALLEVERVVGLCLEGIAAKRMLDVGTGSGLFAEAFAAQGLTVAGIDVSAEMAALAQHHVPQGTFKQAPAEEIPYPDDTFDLVYLGHILHEADDAVQALKEARRVATGRVAVLEWPHIEEEKGPQLAHRLKEDDVRALAAEAGFTAVDVTRLNRMVLYRLDL